MADPIRVQDLLEGGKHEVPPGTFGTTCAVESVIMEDRGAMLPMGRLVNGAVARDFRFQESTSGLEIDLGYIRNRRDLRNLPGDLIKALAGGCLHTLTGKSFLSADMAGPENEGKRLAEIGPLPFADVVYLIMWRAMERGRLERSVPLGRSVPCPRCHTTITEARYNLPRARVPTWTWTPDNPPRSVVHLSKPWASPAGAVEWLVLGPPAWARAMHGMTDEDVDNEARVDAGVAAAAIVAGPDGVEGQILGGCQPSMLRNMASADSDVVREAARVVGGEILPWVPMVCGACELEIPVPFSWRSLGFF